MVFGLWLKIVVNKGDKISEAVCNQAEEKCPAPPYILLAISQSLDTNPACSHVSLAAFALVTLHWSPNCNLFSLVLLLLQLYVLFTSV